VGLERSGRATTAATDLLAAQRREVGVTHEMLVVGAAQDSVTDQLASRRDRASAAAVRLKRSRRDGCCFDHMTRLRGRRPAARRHRRAPAVRGSRFARALTNVTLPTCPSGLRRDVPRLARWRVAARAQQRPPGSRAPARGTLFMIDSPRIQRPDTGPAAEHRSSPSDRSRVPTRSSRPLWPASPHPIKIALATESDVPPMPRRLSRHRGPCRRGALVGDPDDLVRVSSRSRAAGSRSRPD
jgi:hypothetical protein